MFTPNYVDNHESLKQGRFMVNMKEKICADREYIGQTLFENLFQSGI